jgi:hypothetical protein
VPGAGAARHKVKASKRRRYKEKKKMLTLVKAQVWKYKSIEDSTPVVLAIT